MDDIISRQAAIHAFDGICDRECEYSKKQRAVMCASCHLGSAFDAIDELPSAERLGRWVNSEIPNEKYVCSVCGGACWYYDVQGEVAKSAYCPNCGAKMEE